MFFTPEKLFGMFKMNFLPVMILVLQISTNTDISFAYQWELVTKKSVWKIAFVKDRSLNSHERQFGTIFTHFSLNFTCWTYRMFIRIYSLSMNFPPFLCLNFCYHCHFYASNWISRLFAPFYYLGNSRLADQKSLKI